jgi:hypothetical protein
VCNSSAQETEEETSLGYIVRLFQKKKKIQKKRQDKNSGQVVRVGPGGAYL